MILIALSKIEPLTTKSFNHFLKKQGIKNVFLKKLRRNFVGDDRYGLFIRPRASPASGYRQVYEAGSVREAVTALIFYYYPTEERGENFMRLEDILLKLKDINAHDNGDGVVEVIDARTTTDSQQLIDGVRLTIATKAYTRTNVKLPYNSDLQVKLNDLLDALADAPDHIVKVKLIKPVVRPYAMISNGTLYSGVSVKAQDFDILAAK